MQGLQLNYLEIKFNNEYITLPFVKYQDKDWFLKTKSENEDKIFKREGNRMRYRYNDENYR